MYNPAKARLIHRRVATLLYYVRVLRATIKKRRQQKKDTSAAKTATKSGLACAVCAPLQGVYVQVLRGGTLLVPVCGFFSAQAQGNLLINLKILDKK